MPLAAPNPQSSATWRLQRRRARCGAGGGKWVAHPRCGLWGDPDASGAMRSKQTKQRFGQGQARGGPGLPH